MLDQTEYYSNSEIIFDVLACVQFSCSSDAMRGFRIQYTPSYNLYIFLEKPKMFDL